MRYPQVISGQGKTEWVPPEQELSACDGPLREAEMLRVLFRLIGHGETGLFPELDRHRAQIEQTICLYAELLISE